MMWRKARPGPGRVRAAGLAALLMRCAGVTARRRAGRGRQWWPSLAGKGRRRGPAYAQPSGRSQRRGGSRARADGSRAHVCCAEAPRVRASAIWRGGAPQRGWKQQRQCASSGQWTWRSAWAWPAPAWSGACGASCAAPPPLPPAAPRSLRLRWAGGPRRWLLSSSAGGIASSLPPTRPAASPSSSAALLRCSAAPLLRRPSAPARSRSTRSWMIGTSGLAGKLQHRCRSEVLRQHDLAHIQIGLLRRHTRVQHDLGPTAGRGNNAGRSTKPGT